MVVVGDQRLVLIQLLERLDRLDRVGVDDAIPNEVLPLLRRQVLNLLVHDQKLSHAGDVEAGPHVVKRLHDGGGAVGLDRVVDLYARQGVTGRAAGADGTVCSSLAVRYGLPQQAACCASWPVAAASCGPWMLLSSSLRSWQTGIVGFSTAKILSRTLRMPAMHDAQHLGARAVS